MIIPYQKGLLLLQPGKLPRQNDNAGNPALIKWIIFHMTYYPALISRGNHPGQEVSRIQKKLGQPHSEFSWLVSTNVGRDIETHESGLKWLSQYKRSGWVLMKLSRWSSYSLNTPSFEPDLTKRGIKLKGYISKGVGHGAAGYRAGQRNCLPADRQLQHHLLGLHIRIKTKTKLSAKLFNTLLIFILMLTLRL